MIFKRASEEYAGFVSIVPVLEGDGRIVTGIVGCDLIDTVGVVLSQKSGGRNVDDCLGDMLGNQLIVTVALIEALSN